MTPELARELFPVLKAFAEGEKLQIKSCGGWLDLDPKASIAFDLPSDCYRVKPPVRKWWISVHGGASEIFNSLELAQYHTRNSQVEIVEVHEIPKQ